jgi:4-alpha-glucanotransferase
MGDLPFIVGSESSDVWAHARQFRRDVVLGAPPDAFSEDGQDWGLPAYDWAEMDKDDLGWIRARTRHAATLYDRFRLDHVVGYFRQYVKRPGDKRGAFDPDGEDAQRARGERVLRVIQKESGRSRVIGEDLGVIPPFVRQKLAELEIPGYRVLPWENDDGRYRDPAQFPRSSVATWATHDTLPVTAWWDDLAPNARSELGRLAGIAPDEPEASRWLPLLRLLLRSSSELTLVLATEVLGQRARINTPATVDETNWRYRLPMPLEELSRDPDVNRRMDALRELTRETGRD